MIIYRYKLKCIYYIEQSCKSIVPNKIFKTFIT